jgi:hypothetical protein
MIVWRIAYNLLRSYYSEIYGDYSGSEKIWLSFLPYTQDNLLYQNQSAYNRTGISSKRTVMMMHILLWKAKKYYEEGYFA